MDGLMQASLAAHFFWQSQMLRESESHQQSHNSHLSPPTTAICWVASFRPPAGLSRGGQSLPSTSCPVALHCPSSFRLFLPSPLFHIMSSAAPVVAQSAFQRFLNHPAGTMSLLPCPKTMNPRKKNYFFPHAWETFLGYRLFFFLPLAYSMQRPPYLSPFWNASC